MATITSLGVGTNGLDTQSLVDKLVANEQVPLTQLNNITAGLKTQISAYGQIQSALSAVQDAARKLTNPSTWGATTASSSDPSSVSVVAGNGAKETEKKKIKTIKKRIDKIRKKHKKKKKNPRKKKHKN